MGENGRFWLAEPSAKRQFYTTYCGFGTTGIYG